MTENLRRKGLAAVIFGLSVGSFAISGCKTGETPNPGLYELSLVGVDHCPRPPGADPKKRTLGVKVRLKSHVSSGLAGNFFYASLLTHTGERFLAEPEGCTPLLAGKPLGLEEEREGYLNFPVPVEQTETSLLYLPPLEQYGERERARELLLTKSAAPPRATSDFADPSDEFGEITEDE